eukprot:1037215-Prymnesium_polylepis.1
MPTLEEEKSPPAKRPRTADLGPAPPPPEPPTAPPAADVVINRSPVMIIWTAATAQAALGMEWSEALSTANAAAALFARAKGCKLGLYADHTRAAPDAESVWLLGQAVPTQRTEHGIRGLAAPYVAKEVAGAALAPVSPGAAFRSLAAAFGTSFGAVWQAMSALASAVPADRLRADGGRLAYDLYAEFRPNVPDGLQGWGQPGRLSLAQVWRMRERFVPSAAAEGTLKAETSAVATHEGNAQAVAPTVKVEATAVKAAMNVVKTESRAVKAEEGQLTTGVADAGPSSAAAA